MQICVLLRSFKNGENPIKTTMATSSIRSKNILGTVVPPNSRLIGSKKNPGNLEIWELGDLITVVNRSNQKLLLSKIKEI